MIYIALPVSSIHACSFFLISWNNKQFACSVFHLKYTNFIIIMFAPSCITLLDDYRGFFPGRARGQVGKFLREVSMNFRGSFNNIWRRPLLYGLSRASTILGPSPSLKLFLNVLHQDYSVPISDGLTMFSVLSTMRRSIYFAKFVDTNNSDKNEESETGLVVIRISASAPSFIIHNNIIVSGCSSVTGDHARIRHPLCLLLTMLIPQPNLENSFPRTYTCIMYVSNN